MAEKASRAKQFLPFASLKGYFDMILEQKRVKEERRERSEEEDERLSNIVMQLQPGMMVRVRYYAEDSYVYAEGLIGGIDLYTRMLTVVKKKIPLDDIFSIECDALMNDL